MASGGNDHVLLAIHGINAGRGIAGERQVRRPDLHVRGHDYPLRSTIGGFESRLHPARFVRVHRTIVNLDHLRHSEPADSGDARLHMTDGAQPACSRRYLPATR